MKKLLALFLCFLMLCLSAAPVFGASDEPVIDFQPQQPYYPEYAVAAYTVKVTGSNLTVTWFLEYEGKTYNLCDFTNGFEPWEAYAGESYGSAEEEPGVFLFYFAGIEAGLNGAYIWCEVEDGHYSVTSQKALITVGNYGSPPVIEEIPSQLSVEVDDLAEIRCVALAPGDSQLEYLWYETPTGRLEDMRAVNRGTETADTLVPDSSTVGTTYYICQVTSNQGGITYSSAVKYTVAERAPMVYPPAIVTKSIPEATVGTPYQVKLTASDPNANFWLYYNPNQPNDFEKTGLTLRSDGTISGTPTSAGSFTFCVCAGNDGGEDYATYTLHVKEASGKTPGGNQKPGSNKPEADPTAPAPTVSNPTAPAPTAPIGSNTPATSQEAPAFPWLIVVLVGVISAGIGIGVALLITRKK